jgi:hypothetical protein
VEGIRLLQRAPTRWPDIVEAAEWLRHDLGVLKPLWAGRRALVPGGLAVSQPCDAGSRQSSLKILNKLDFGRSRCVAGQVDQSVELGYGNFR